MAQNLEKTTANNCAAEGAFSCLTIFFNQDVLVEISGLLHPPSARLPRKCVRAARAARTRQNSPFWPIFDTFLKLFPDWFGQFSGKFPEN